MPRPFAGVRIIDFSQVLAGPPQHVWVNLRHTFPELEDPTPPGADLPTKAALRLQAIQAWMQGQPSQEVLFRKLEEARLPCSPVQSLREALDGDFGRERGLLTEVDDRRGGTRRVLRLPYRFSRSELRTGRSAARRGEHNAEVLRELLDLDAARIRELEAEGVLLADPHGER